MVLLRLWGGSEGEAQLRGNMQASTSLFEGQDGPCGNAGNVDDNRSEGRVSPTRSGLSEVLICGEQAVPTQSRHLRDSMKTLTFSKIYKTTHSVHGFQAFAISYPRRMMNGVF